MLIHVVCALLFHTGWIETFGDSDVHRPSQLVFCRLTSNSDRISLAIKIVEDFSWSLQLHGRSIEPDACSILSAVPQHLVSAELVGQLAHQLEQTSICPGNHDEKFLSLAASRKGIFMSHSGRCSCMCIHTVYVCCLLGSKARCATNPGPLLILSSRAV